MSRSDITPLTTFQRFVRPLYRYRHGELIGVALDFMNTRNVRDLSKAGMRDGQWTQLQNFLKGVKVNIKTDKTNKRRVAVKMLVDRAGYHVFENSDGQQISVTVTLVSLSLVYHCT